MNSSEIKWNTDRIETFKILGAEFDIQKAKRIIVATPRQLGTIATPELKFCSRWVATFWRLEKDADMSIPIIFCSLGAGHLLIDGWHRLHSAEKRGIGILPTIYLNPSETKLIMRLP